MKKTEKNSGRGGWTRQTVRHPEETAGFATRIGQVVREVGISQRKLAAELGGYRNQTLSRLFVGKMTAIPIDLLVRLLTWAEVRGYCAKWIAIGTGAKTRKEALESSGPGSTSNHLMLMRMVLVLADRVGVDIQDIMQRSFMTIGSPDVGMLISPLREAMKMIGDKTGVEVPLPGAGYRTVGPESVPTASDWWKHYVPILGRIAAGKGLDTVEASEYPPAWAGEFVAHDGAPQSAVAVRVKGDSMLPDYADGDMVIVDPAQTAEPGQVCCVVLDVDGLRDARLKRLKLSGPWAILESTNPAFPAERVAADRVVGAYKVVERLPLFGWERKQE